MHVAEPWPRVSGGFCAQTMFQVYLEHYEVSRFPLMQIAVQERVYTCMDVKCNPQVSTVIACGMWLCG
jgi:hypothetical protein